MSYIYIVWVTSSDGCSHFLGPFNEDPSDDLVNEILDKFVEDDYPEDSCWESFKLAAGKTCIFNDWTKELVVLDD